MHDAGQAWRVMQPLDIRAVYQGAPLKDTQIEVFEKAPDGGVSVFMDRTDADGNATIPVKRGHRYMLDAVVLRPLEVVDDDDPAWGKPLGQPDLRGARGLGPIPALYL